MANVMLEVRDLTTKYLTRFRENVYAVDHVSLKVEEGKSLGIAGESGCGKSTLALSLMGYYFAPLHYMSGDIIINDILPYIASYVIMALILQISSAILAEAGLSILGLGPRTTEVPTLGLMMNWAMIYQAELQGRWWAYFPVLITIALITVSMNLMITGLDQVFNPALRG